MSSGPLRLGPGDGELPRVEGVTLVHAGGPFEAHLVVSVGDELLGLSRVTASRDAPTRITLALPDRLPADARIELALYDTGASAEVTTRSIWDAFDPQVAMLPGISPQPDDG